jgi:hypothetical protein
LLASWAAVGAEIYFQYKEFLMEQNTPSFVIRGKGAEQAASVFSRPAPQAAVDKMKVMDQLNLMLQTRRLARFRSVT